MYIYGPGGVLRDSASQSLSSSPSSSSAATIQNDNLKKLDKHPALVLNADYQPMSLLPLSLWRWQDAVKAILAGKAQVVDVYDNVAVRAATYQLALPSVIALTDYVHPTSTKSGGQRHPAFTRRNVFLRDEYQCQYCLLPFHSRDLTLDHVVPRSQGGCLQWTNAVTCCKHCNNRKGSLTLAELRRVGMKLGRPPTVPSKYQLERIAGRMLPRRVHATWEPYVPVVRNKEAAEEKEDKKEE